MTMSELHRALEDRSNAFRPTQVPPFSVMRARKRTRDRRRAGATVTVAAVAMVGIALGPAALGFGSGAPAPDRVAADPTPVPSQVEPTAAPTAAAAATFQPAAPVPKYACGAEGSGEWPERTVDYQAYEGLTFEQAQELAVESGDTLRVLGQDGVCAKGPFTADSRGDRVNVYLDSGRVVSAYPG